MKRVIVLIILCVLIGYSPTRATVETETCKITYTATSGLTAYPYTFKIFADSDLVVMVRNALGIEHTLTLTTDYTVSGVGSDAGGTVTFATAPYITYGSGSTVVIYSSIPYTQETDFLEGGRFSADTLEGVLDKNIRLIQQINGDVARAVKLPLSSTASAELPDPALNAGRLLMINAAGDAIDTIAVAESGVCPDFTAYCTPTDLTNMRQHTYQSLGNLQRSKFTYVDSTTITIGPGVYDHCGGSFWQTVFWGSTITFTNTLLGTGWRYLYIDDSTITAAPSMLTSDNFIVSATAPAWSALLPRRGWYNGNDRCIFAFYVFLDTIWPFYHDGGDYVQYQGEGAPNRNYTDRHGAETETVTIPAFSTRGKFSIFCTLNDAYLVYVSTTTSAYRTLGYGAAGTDVHFSLFEHYTSPSQSLTIALSAYTGTNSVALQTNGWYFPTGM